MHRSRTIVLALSTLALALTLAACTQPSTSIDLQLANASITVQPGNSSSLALSAVPKGGFTGTLDLTLVDTQGKAASGFALTPTTLTLQGTQPNLSGITLHAASTVSAGSYPLLLEASSSSVSTSLPLSVTVDPNPTPDFSFAASPLTLPTTPGGHATTTVVVAPQNGFAGTITLSLVDSQGNTPTGLTLTPATVTVTDTQPTLASITVHVASTVATGSYPLLLQANGGGANASLPLNVTVQPTPVPDFSLAASPATLTTGLAGNATTTLLLAPQNSFSGTLSLTLENRSGNVAGGASISPTTVTLAAGQSTAIPIRLTAASSLPAGTHTYILNATGNGIAHTTPLTLVLSSTATGTFNTAATYPTGNHPNSVAIGDLNGDGKPDLAAANPGGNTVSVLLGNGDGTLNTATNYPTGRYPNSVAIGDLNGDGKPDLATANRSNDGASILLGNGDGTFNTATNYPVNGVASVAIGDLNGDGKPDVATANIGDNTVSVLLGNGNGTFNTATNYPTGRYPSSVAIGDLNGDGNPDLTIANSGSQTVSVLLGNGDGTFNTATNYPVNGVGSVAIGDLNGDGKPDLATANAVDNTVSVLLGNGDGTFNTATNYPTGGGPIPVAIGDLNGDGKLDLATATIGGVSVLLGQ